MNIFRAELGVDEGGAVATASGRNPQPGPATLWGGQEATLTGTSTLTGREVPPMSDDVDDMWEPMITLDFSVGRGVLASSFLGSGRRATAPALEQPPPLLLLHEQQQQQL